MAPRFQSTMIGGAIVAAASSAISAGCHRTQHARRSDDREAAIVQRQSAPAPGPAAGEESQPPEQAPSVSNADLVVSFDGWDEVTLCDARARRPSGLFDLTVRGRQAFASAVQSRPGERGLAWVVISKSAHMRDVNRLERHELRSALRAAGYQRVVFEPATGELGLELKRLRP